MLVLTVLLAAVGPHALAHPMPLGGCNGAPVPC
jgi:hypothetical protein